MRVFYFRGGVKVCPVCWTPLYGVRRDAVAHKGCVRERRRSRVAVQNGYPVPTVGSNGNGSRRVAEGRQRVFLELSPHACPDCGCHEFYVRLLARVLVGHGEAGSVEIGPRKMLTCTRCDWRGSVAKARDAA